MDYSLFKPLQGLLFFGGALAFGVWQLLVVRKSIHDARGQGSSGRVDAESQAGDS